MPVEALPTCHHAMFTGDDGRPLLIGDLRPADLFLRLNGLH